MIAAVANHVHDIVNGDPPHHQALFFHDRCGHPVVAFELARDLVTGSRGGNGFAIGDHQFAHRAARVRDQQGAHGQESHVAIVAADHDEHVGHLGYLVVAAQVAQHHIEGDVGANRDRVRIHKAAGGVLGVDHDLL